MPHERARRRIRRELLHSMQMDNGPERRAASSEEIKEMVHDIQSNKISRFGLVRLSGLILHVTVDEPPLDTCGPLTLIELACLIPKRDKFIGALLRAGCDASWTRDGYDETSSDAREVLSSLQPMAAVWVVKQVVGMRWRWRGLSEKERGSICIVPSCQHMHQRDESRVRSFLSWPCGHHSSCEACFWRELRGRRDEGGCIDHAFTSTSCQPSADTLSQDLLSNSKEEAFKIKIDSKSKWLDLPLLPPSQASTSQSSLPGNRPKKFEAKPASEVARLFIGGTRSQRQQRLFDAATEGNVERIRALVEAGVDLDATNEMGMTSIFTSSFYGHLAAVRLLASAGADLQVASNGGATCFDVSRAMGHSEVAEFIRNQLGSEDVGSNRASSEFELISSPSSLDPSNIAAITLIPLSSSHPGAGAFLIDNAVTSGEMDRLISLFHRLEGAGASSDEQYYTCDVERRHFSDSEGWVSGILTSILERAKKSSCSPELSAPGAPLPFMRFLHYTAPLSMMAPHVDLSKTVRDPRGDKAKSKRASRFTFLLYLSSSMTSDGGGGRRCCSREREREAPTLAQCGEVLHSIRPMPGRLLVYPHKTPHAEVLVPPKCWFHPSAGSTQVLVPPKCWFHPSAGSTQVLVPPKCWFHPSAGSTQDIAQGRVLLI